MRGKGLAWILGGGFLLRVLFAVSIPAFQAPDEYSHFTLIRDLATGRGYPTGVLDGPDYEARFQPPLYYVLASWVYRAMPEYRGQGSGVRDRQNSGGKGEKGKRGKGIETDSQSPQAEHHAINNPQPAIQNAERAEAGPIGGGPVWKVPRVLALRGLSVLLGVVICVLTYLIAGQAFPESAEIRLSATAFVAFLPSSISSTVSVSNDPLAVALGGLFLLLALRANGRLRPRESVLLASVLAVGIWVKYNLLAFIPLVFLMPMEGTRRQKLANVAIFLVLTLGLFSPWLIRNVNQYHAALGEVRLGFDGFSPGVSLRVLRNFFWSFWAAFGQFYEIHLPLAAYIVVFPLFSLASAAGLVRFLARKPTSPDLSLGPGGETNLRLLLAASGLAVLASLSYSLSYQVMCSWGRYAFPALPAIGALFVAGLARLSPLKLRRVVVWGTIAVLIVCDLYYLGVYLL